jgi:hypothetical protein
MRTQSPDTHPEIERVQIEMLRKAGATEGARLTRSLSQEVMQMSWNVIRRMNPNISEEETGILFVELNYGEKLAKSLQEHLEQRKLTK